MDLKNDPGNGCYLQALQRLLSTNQKGLSEIISQISRLDEG